MARIPPRPVLDSRRFGRTSFPFLLGLVACSLVAIIVLAVVVAQRGPAPATAGFLLALLPVPLILAVILLIDRLEPEPRALLAAIFGAGAGVAGIIALLGHVTGSAAIAIPELGPHAGRAVSISVGAAITAALVAESLKGLVLLALLPSRRTEIDGATDGVVYATMIGLGFALVGNAYAYTVAWSAGAAALAEEFARRGVFSPLWQALFTSMIGLGIAYAAARRRSSGYWAIVVGWIVAVALDALWSKSVTAGGATLAVTYLILFVVLITVIALVGADWRRVVAMIRNFLPQFAITGTIALVDIRMLTSLRMRRLGRQWARLNLGIDGMRAMREYQLAATELAMACNRNHHGRLTPENFVKHRDNSLLLMRDAATLIRDREQLFPPPWVGNSPSAFVR